jgi:hypothetical protein
MIMSLYFRAVVAITFLVVILQLLSPVKEANFKLETEFEAGCDMDHTV